MPLALSLPPLFPLLLPHPPPLSPSSSLPPPPLSPSALTLLFPLQLFDILLPSRAIHLATFRFMAAPLPPLAGACLRVRILAAN